MIYSISREYLDNVTGRWWKLGGSAELKEVGNAGDGT